MASEELWGGVATAAINQTGNIISTAMTNSANEDMQRRQNAWNLEQWNRNNAYNHPAAQLQRLKAAGLNPDLMYGQNAGGAMGNSPAPAQGSNPIPKQPFQMTLDPLMLAHIKNIEADTKLKLSDSKQKDSQTRSIDFDNLTKENETLLIKEFNEQWKSYDPQKKREMIANMLDTMYIQYSNALVQAKAGKFQAVSDYWTHVTQIYSQLGSLYGFDDLKVTEGGIEAGPVVMQRMLKGEVQPFIKDQVLGALKQNNIQFVDKHLQILEQNLSQEQFETIIKQYEAEFQKWYNGKEGKIHIPILDIDLTPREIETLFKSNSMGYIYFGSKLLEKLGELVQKAKIDPDKAKLFNTMAPNSMQ